jgi:hypothetical protein
MREICTSASTRGQQVTSVSPAVLEHFHSFCTAVLRCPEPVALAILSPVPRSWYRPPAEIGSRDREGANSTLFAKMP